MCNMKKNRIVFIIWILSWIIIWLRSETGGIAPAIIIATIAYAFLDILFVCHCSKFIKISLNSPLSIKKKDIVNVNICVNNKSFFSIFCIKGSLGFYNMLTGENNYKDFKMQAGGKTASSTECLFSSANCGKLHINIVDLCAYDIFGLFGKKINTNDDSVTLVIPEVYPVHISLSNIRQLDMDSNEYSMYRWGGDPSETFALREYVPGDNLRCVHWKLSEKGQNIIVRQLGLPVNNSILLVMESHIIPETLVTPSMREAVGEVIISLSAELCQQGIDHHILFENNDKTYVISEIDSQDSLSESMPELLSVEMIEREQSVAAGYIEDEGYFSYAHVIIVTALDIEEDLAMFNGSNITYIHSSQLMNVREEMIYLEC